MDENSVCIYETIGSFKSVISDAEIISDMYMYTKTKENNSYHVHSMPAAISNYCFIQYC